MKSENYALWGGSPKSRRSRRWRTRRRKPRDVPREPEEPVPAPVPVPVPAPVPANSGAGADSDSDVSPASLPAPTPAPTPTPSRIKPTGSESVALRFSKDELLKIPEYADRVDDRSFTPIAIRQSQADFLKILSHIKKELRIYYGLPESLSDPFSSPFAGIPKIKHDDEIDIEIEPMDFYWYKTPMRTVLVDTPETAPDVNFHIFDHQNFINDNSLNRHESHLGKMPDERLTSPIYYKSLYNGLLINFKRVENIMKRLKESEYMRPFKVTDKSDPVILFSLYHSELILTDHKTGEYERKSVPKHMTIIQMAKTSCLNYIKTIINNLLNFVETKENSQNVLEFLEDPSRKNFMRKLVDTSIFEELCKSNRTCVPAGVTPFHSYREGETYPDLSLETSNRFGEGSRYEAIFIPGVYSIFGVIEMLLIMQAIGAHFPHRLAAIIEHPLVKKKLDDIKSRAVYTASFPGMRLSNLIRVVPTLPSTFYDYTRPDRKFILMHLGCKGVPSNGSPISRETIIAKAIDSAEKQRKEG